MTRPVPGGASAAVAAARVVGLLAAGLATGLAAVAVHGRPWGLPLAVLATIVGLLALPPGLGTRVPAAAGWSAAVLLAVVGRPEGDVAVQADVPGWTLLLMTGAVPLFAVVTLPRRRRNG